MKHTEFSDSDLFERKQADKWKTWKQSRKTGRIKQTNLASWIGEK